VLNVWRRIEHNVMPWLHAPIFSDETFCLTAKKSTVHTRTSDEEISACSHVSMHPLTNGVQMYNDNLKLNGERANRLEMSWIFIQTTQACVAMADILNTCNNTVN